MVGNPDLLWIFIFSFSIPFKSCFEFGDSLDYIARQCLHRTDAKLVFPVLSRRYVNTCAIMSSGDEHIIILVVRCRRRLDTRSPGCHTLRS